MTSVAIAVMPLSMLAAVAVHHCKSTVSTVVIATIDMLCDSLCHYVATCSIAIHLAASLDDVCGESPHCFIDSVYYCSVFCCCDYCNSCCCYCVGGHHVIVLMHLKCYYVQLNCAAAAAAAAAVF
eukprot:5593-Heterococcus_DN1.PRE.7